MEDQPKDVPEFVKSMTNVPLFVGMIANSWARVEHSLVGLAMKLLRTTDENVARIVVFALNPPAKRDLLLALSENAPITDEQKAQIQKFAAEFDRLRKLRNDIVHGRWDMLSKAGTPILYTASARSELKERFEEKETKWLIVTRNEVEALIPWAFDLSDWLTGLYPSTGKPQQQYKPR